MPVHVGDHYFLVCIVLSDLFLDEKDYVIKSKNSNQKFPVAYVMVFDSLEKTTHIKAPALEFMTNIYR